MIHKVVKELINHYNCVFVGGVHSYDIGGDIDFLCKPGQRSLLVSFLQSKGFLVRENPGRGILAYIFINHDLFVIDIADSESQELLLCFNSDVKFKSNFIEEILVDEKLEKFMRYVLQFRNKKDKFFNFVANNFDFYGQYLSDTTYLSKPIFKRNIVAKDVVSAMKRDFISMSRVLPFSRLIKIKFSMMMLHVRRFGTGKVIAFVGADGSGKTTAINKTWQVIGSHKIYMGDVNFKLQEFYNWLLNKPLYFARLIYIFMYIENWLRYLWILSRKIKGDIIITDRWPGLNQHLKSNSKKMLVHDFIYKFFPDADLYIFLSGNPEVIYSRKQELTVEEINILQKNMREKLKGKKYLEVKNENLDESLMKILRKLLKIHWEHTFLSL